MNDNDPLWDKSLHLNRALGVLEEIQAAGYALVPIAPTPAMIKAAMLVSGHGVETVTLVYHAMIGAAGDEVNTEN